MNGRRNDSRNPRRRRVGRALLPALGVLVAGVVLSYVTVDDEPHPLDDSARAGAAGSFVSLSAGRTYYEAAGPEDAQTVVLVHGTTMPSFVWDRNFEELARAGLRVVRYDLYGRGLSDRPEGRYDLDFHVAQLEELLARVAPGRPVDLVGFSLGGILVTEFTRRHPGQVRRVVLLAPAGVGTELPLVAKVVRAPGVGEYVMRVAGSRQLLPSRRMMFRPDRQPGFDSTYLQTIRFRGSRRAVLESLRHMPLDAYEDGYRELGALGKPVLVVSGRHDAVVPFAGSERVGELVRSVALVAVEDAGHLAQYERPDVVNAALLDFLLAR